MQDWGCQQLKGEENWQMRHPFSTNKGSTGEHTMYWCAFILTCFAKHLVKRGGADKQSHSLMFMKYRFAKYRFASR